MAGTISESYLSRSFTIGLFQAGRELEYDIQDTEDEAEVEALLYATAPAVYRGRVLENVASNPLGGGLWKGYARYIRFDADSEYTFSTGGGTKRITQSISTVGAYAAPGLTAPDFEGAIGVSEDRVEGADIIGPTYQFTETHRFADGFVDGAYRLVLFNLTGRINNATFKGFAAGEVLFLGASGGKRGDEQWSITFSFAANPNLTGITFGTITGIAAGGWDYLWTRHADYVDSFAYALVKRPVAVYVEQVYFPGDFSAMAIGT